MKLCVLDQFFPLFRLAQFIVRTNFLARNWCSGGSRETLYLVLRPCFASFFLSSGKNSLVPVTLRFFAPSLSESDKTLQSGSVFSALSIGAIYSSLTFFVFEI